jgi:signal transduction histidine kinase
MWPSGSPSCSPPVSRRAPRAERPLFAGVGATWLVGSVEASAQLLHQGVLAVALVASPSGRVRGLPRWAIVALAVLAGLGYLSQLGVVLLFAAVAGLALATLADEPLAKWYSATMAGLVAIVLGWIWLTTQLSWRSWTPDEGLLMYHSVLLLVAGGFLVSTRLFDAERQRLADRLLTDEGLEGLDGLARVLGEMLDDPQLRVFRWDESGGDNVDAFREHEPGRQLLIVTDSDRRIAGVEHHASAVADPRTVAAVSAAVRLVMANVRLREALAAQRDDLDAARRRLVTAGDRQRVATATRLRNEVIAPIESAIGELHQVVVGPAGAAAVLDVARAELAGAVGEIEALVAGVPRGRLGDGQLDEAVRSLAGRSPVPVTVTTSGDTAAAADIETTLLYVVSEALANATKHADATMIHVEIRGVADAVVVSIRDNGHGGADPSGSGLQGLADRVAARGGRLEIASPWGSGTTVVSTIPR